MNRKTNRRVIAQVFFILITIAASVFSIFAQETPSTLPHLRRQGTATQLIVKGKPFLIRGGELGNSSSSSAEYMKPVWAKLSAMNLNTVLMPVY